MTLILDRESGSDDLQRSFESGSGQVSSDAYADNLLVRSTQTVPAYVSPTTEPVDVGGIEALEFEAAESVNIATQSEPSIGDRIGTVFTNILGTLTTTAEAAAQGAIEGATAASAGAQAGSSVGAKATTFSTTTLILGALVLVLILRR